MTKRVIDVDLADVFEQPKRKGYLHTLAWGDYVEVVETTPEHLRIQFTKFVKQKDGSIKPVDVQAYICPPNSSNVKPENVTIPVEDSHVLKVNFIDVQQGDGAVIETPDGKVILVDGGDNQMFARYLASRFRDTSKENPQKIDCILVTHGDADHFVGLTEIFVSQKNAEPTKRLFISPQRVYHNGLVKRPGKDENQKDVPDKELLGVTKEIDGETIITGLHEDLLSVPDSEMNAPFLRWKKALASWSEQGEIEFRKLSFGDDDAFDFLRDEGLEVRVLSPFLTKKGEDSGLKFLGNPPQGPRVGHESLDTDAERFKGFSASHTINGHSIVLQLRYGGFNYLFSGDLNDEAGRTLVSKHNEGSIDLRSEVFKVPHHGSADFSAAFLKMVSPIVSIVSSGDESSKKEYIHPRATLIGSLGRYSRNEEPLIFVTELVAFMKLEGWARLTDEEKNTKRGEFFSFSRAAYGMVKTRTNGRRLLIYTNSGKTEMKEAYCYDFTPENGVVPSPIVRV